MTWNDSGSTWLQLALPDSSQVQPAAPDSQFGNFRMSQSTSESIILLCNLMYFCTILVQYELNRSPIWMEGSHGSQGSKMFHYAEVHRTGTTLSDF